MVVSKNDFLGKADQRENAQYIMTYLLKEGWTKNAIAGMLGNMETESTINPGIWQSLRTNNLNGGYGLVQWTPASKYIDWAKGRGLDYKKMDSNLKRILYEVDKNIQWINKNMTFKQFTKSKETPYELGLKFLKYYERPANPNQPSRGTQAQYWYDTLSGAEPTIPKDPEPVITPPKPKPTPPPVIDITPPKPVIPPKPPKPTEPTTKPNEAHKIAGFSYRRDMLTVNNEFMVHPFSCQEKEVLNAERTLEISLVKTNNNGEAFESLETEAELQLGDEEYVIKEKQGFMVGKNPAKKLYALHIFFSIAEQREDEELTGNLALSDALSFALNNSGWGYEIYGENPKLRKENFGNDNKLALFNKILKDWDVEYILDTPKRMVKVYPRVGGLVDHTFRYNHNIKSLKVTQDTRSFRTAIKGYGKAETVTVNGEEVTTQLVAEYISPASEKIGPDGEKYGLRWADPIQDERFTIKENLEAYLKATLQDEPIFTVETDVSQVDEDYDPSLGDAVLTLHEPLGLDLDTRITEITRFPFDKTKRTQVVISNISPDEARKLSEHYVQLAVMKKTNEKLLSQYKKVESNIDTLNTETQSTKTEVNGVKNELAQTSKSTAKSERITVGDNGDFKTINSALSSLSQKQPRYVKNGITVEIYLLSGYVMEEQVSVSGIDLGWITISSEAKKVTINRDSIKDVLIESRKPAFFGTNNAVLPTIGCLFSYNEGTEANCDGIAVAYGSKVRLLPGAGVDNPSRGLAAYYSSEAFCYIEGLTEGGAGTGAGSTKGVSFKNCTNRAFMATYGSKISCARSQLQNCQGDNAVYVIWGSEADIYQSDISSALNTAVHSRDGSKVNARETNVSDSNRGYHALHNATINARYYVNEWSGDGAKRCREYGVLASYNSNIDASGLPVDGSKTGVHASNSSNISFVDAATATGCETGIQATGVSSIDCEGVTATNCTDKGISAEEGSRINAKSAILTGSAKPVVSSEMSQINCSYVTGGNSVPAFQVLQGSFINTNSATGALSQAANIPTNNGIIFN